MVNYKDGILHFLMLSYNLQLLMHMESWTSLVMVAKILLHSWHAVCQSAHNGIGGIYVPVVVFS